MEGNSKGKIIIAILIVIVVGIVSFFGLGTHYSDPATYEKTIQTLEEKESAVVAMTASAAAVSTGLAAIPGDATDPIANELADLSSTFMIIVAAILLEKYLLTLSGALAFKILIPLACALIIAYIITRRELFVKAAGRLAIFGICLVLLVPVSTYVTNVIDETHDISTSINIEKANDFADDLQKNADKEDSVVKKWISKFSGGMKGIISKANAILENFINATAILIITSCVIPLLTLWLMIWLMRTILGLNIKLPTGKLKAFARGGSKVRKKALGKEEKSLIDESK